MSHPNNILGFYLNRPAGTAYYHKPRGAWKIKQIYARAADRSIRVPGIANDAVYVTFEVMEPLLVPKCLRLGIR